MGLKPSLTVNSSTTAAQLDQFAQGLNDGMRLKGKQNDDGSITLYASHNKSGFLSKMSGRAQDRIDLAKRAITQVGENDVRSADKSLIRNLTQHRQFAKPNSTALKEIASFANAMSGDLANQRAQENSKIGLSELPFDARVAVRDAGDAMIARLNDDGLENYSTQGIADTLSDSLAAALSSPEMRALHPDFELSDGKDLVAALNTKFRDMANATGEGKLPRIIKDELRELAQQTVQQTMNKMLGGEISDDMAVFTIDGKAYDRGPKLAQGGFGEVVRYDAQDGSGSLAVKFELEINDSSHDSLAQEIKAHRHAAAEPNDNILGFSGAARTREGNFVIATPLAGAGDGAQARDAIAGALADGKISQKTAQTVALTVMVDVIKGMQHLHDTAGMTHIDFKEPNLFISEDGTSKIADFGTTVMTETPTLTDSNHVDQYIWKDPKVLYASNSSQELNALKPQSDEAGRAFAENFFMPGERSVEDKAAFKRMKSAIAQSFLDVSKADYFEQTQFDGRSYDMFALGVTTANMLSGDFKLSETNFNFDAPAEKQQIGLHENSVAPIGAHDGAVRTTLGDRYVDDLVNLMTHPDPDKRATDFGALLDHDAFQRIDIGSQSARQMLVALMAGDDAAIRRWGAELDT
ncbi:protein kinase domain-containing protein [Celeribacter sp.]|uniref:protein kinase domain-containing protein n=1 Tax=Celeribacter sp. TaxID=1890673 RepID=UPI003A93ACC9